MVLAWSLFFVGTVTAFLPQPAAMFNSGIGSPIASHPMRTPFHHPRMVVEATNNAREIKERALSDIKAAEAELTKAAEITTTTAEAVLSSAEKRLTSAAESASAAVEKVTEDVRAVEAGALENINAAVQGLEKDISSTVQSVARQREEYEGQVFLRQVSNQSLHGCGVCAWSAALLAGQWPGN